MKKKCKNCEYYPCYNIGVDINKCNEYKEKQSNKPEYEIQSFSYTIFCK